MKWLKWIFLFAFTTLAYAQSGENPFGQIIRIDTRLHSYVGKPIWNIVVRDLDHNQNIPYIFDLRRGGNHWIVLTYGINYLITASNMQIETYQSGYNKYKNFRMKNFCNLESNGRIMRGQSMIITLEGDLTPNTNTYTCNIITYPDENFYIYKSN